MLLTTYLAYLRNKKIQQLVDKGLLRNPKIYYVMRNRGNNEVAPSKTLLKVYKEVGLPWASYVDYYVKSLAKEETRNWMQKIDSEAAYRDVILVCFEKDREHCHRRLLAEEINRRHKTHYFGELSKLDQTSEEIIAQLENQFVMPQSNPECEGYKFIDRQVLGLLREVDELNESKLDHSLEVDISKILEGLAWFNDRKLEQFWKLNGVKD